MCNFWAPIGTEWKAAGTQLGPGTNSNEIEGRNVIVLPIEQKDSQSSNCLGSNLLRTR